MKESRPSAINCEECRSKLWVLYHAAWVGDGWQKFYFGSLYVQRRNSPPKCSDRSWGLPNLLSICYRGFFL